MFLWVALHAFFRVIVNVLLDRLSDREAEVRVFAYRDCNSHVILALVACAVAASATAVTFL